MRPCILIRCFCVFIVQWISYTAFSQEITADPIIDKLRAYSNKAVQEKIFLHTDKEFYISGEIVWFKLYYVNGTTHEPFDFSKVAYAEILNDNNEPVAQAKVSLKPEDQAGSFYLPTSLPTGYYTIRAYTSWMKNFDAAYFFEKKIAVVNTLKVAESRTDRDTAVFMDFFPEGGYLVEGIQSKVGFKITGNVKDIRGFVISRNNDTVATFSPFKFGIGSFMFKPEPGNIYIGVVVLPNGTSFRRPFPVAGTAGYVMALNESSPGQVKVTVRKKGETGAQGVEQLTLIAHTRQKLDIAQKAFITGGENAVFTIDKTKIGNGVTHFTIFNSAGAPLCERLYFKKPSKELSLEIGGDKSSYARREKVSLSFNTRSTSTTDLSVSVYQFDSLQGKGETGIVDYMWLTSDLVGSIESPGWYFSNDPAVEIAVDNLMLTHGWRKFDWKDIMTGKRPVINYLPELNGHFVTGLVTDSRYDSPVKGIQTYLSVSGEPFGFYTSESDANGFVYYDVKNYYGNGRVIAQPGIGIDSFYKIKVLSPFFSILTTRRKYPPFILSEQMRESLLRKSIGMQTQNIYRGDSLRNFSDPYIDDTLPFFGKAEARYWLDDYKRFPTMEEVLREYVREVGVGARNERLIFKIFNPLAHDYYDSHSLVLLDGVPVTDANRIFRYDPFKVKSLEVIQGRYVLGHSVFNGIASFTTYEGAFDGYDLNTNLVAVDYAGLQLQRHFYSPVYETKGQLESRVPDFRSTLFWAPHVSIEKDGKTAVEFYSSDIPGKYVVVAQGMDDKGGFVSESIIVEVK